MPIDQIIKQDNGDGTVTVTAITSDGNSETTSYDKDWSDSHINDTINEAIQGALDKD